VETYLTSALVSSRAGSRDLLTKPSVAFGNAACSFLILKGVILDGSEPRPQRTLPTRGVAGELHRCHASALAGFRSQAGAFFILLLDAARCSVSAHRVHRAFPHAFSMWPARLCRAMAAPTWFERVSLHAAAISGASCRLPAQGPDPRASTSCVRRQLLSRW